MSAERAACPNPVSASALDEPEAFLAAVEPWEGPLYRHCLRLLGNAGDAEDLCQEALARAYRQRGRYRPEYRFSTWLFTLATRLCLSELRRRQVRPLFGARDETALAEVPAPQPGPRRAAQRREAERLLLAALTRLPLKYRAPLSLHYEKELCIAEIAEILEISANLVKVRLFRGREKLLELLRPHLEGPEEG